MSHELITTEAVQGTLVFETANRRNNVHTAVLKYLARNAAGTRSHSIQVVDGKYGPFALVINCSFVSRADADEAWADMESVNANFLIAPSEANQFTSLEGYDEETGQWHNDNTFVHVKHWPAEPDDF